MERKFEYRWGCGSGYGDSIEKVYSPPRIENRVGCCSGIGDARFLRKESVKSAHVPEEVTTQILIRLPVKSLLRVRCVSKSFCTLIDSPHFINLHLNFNASPQNRTHFKLIFVENCRIVTNYNSAILHASDLYNDNKPLLENPWEKHLAIVCFCNGVFLVLFKPFQLALWNPSTHQRRILPPCPINLTRKCYDCALSWMRLKSLRKMGFQFGLGLAHDSIHDEYKVVFFSHVGNPCGFQVWIFGLESNSWRCVLNGPDVLPRQGLFIPFGCYANGDLHWLRVLDNSMDIVSFDAANETFSLVSLPFDQGCFEFPSLHVLDGSLCISFLSDGEKAVLYARKKNGGNFTWSLLYSVTTEQLLPLLEINHLRDVRVYGYSKEGDKIMLDICSEYMISYDLNKRSFQIVSALDECHSTRPCFESLVSITDGSLQGTVTMEHM